MGHHICYNQQKVKRGLWSPEEDEKLVSYIRNNGYGFWSEVPKKAGLQRCGKSCRLRWINYLRPDVRRGKFSLDEAKIIINLHSIVGNRWAHIASHLPGRTDNEIKNYWNYWIKKNLARYGRDCKSANKPTTSTDSSKTSETSQRLEEQEAYLDSETIHRTSPHYHNSLHQNQVHLNDCSASIMVDKSVCNMNNYSTHHNEVSDLDLAVWANDKIYTSYNHPSLESHNGLNFSSQNQPAPSESTNDLFLSGYCKLEEIDMINSEELCHIVSQSETPPESSLPLSMLHDPIIMDSTNFNMRESTSAVPLQTDLTMDYNSNYLPQLIEHNAYSWAETGDVKFECSGIVIESMNSDDIQTLSKFNNPRQLPLQEDQLSSSQWYDIPYCFFLSSERVDSIGTSESISLPYGLDVPI